MAYSRKKSTEPSEGINEKAEREVCGNYYAG
jgi:hypothetical protein